MASSLAPALPLAPPRRATPAAPAPAPATSDVIAPPTAEMARWADRLKHMLRPGALAGMLLVTPIAHVATQSLLFQTYLFAVFHRTRLARAGHWLLMPLIVLAVLTTGFALHGLVGALLTIVLASSYARVALRHDMPLLGTLGALVALGLGAGGYALVTAAAVSAATAGAAMLVLSLGQALSHVLEDVPPRVSGTSDWMPLRAFFARSPVRSAVRATVMLIAGTANELWGSGRLLLVLLLDLLWRAGYQREARALHERQLALACQRANPAIDFIGQGGTRLSPYA